ncbi:MAG: DUF664 domain-containing protein [bacterium]|nr:DUF664 domain-containing protein [bacterium]
MQMVPEDFLTLINQALDGMLQIAEELGDERVNLRPNLPDANSPYAILTHCVGLTRYWIGEILAGRPSHRDREAEFNASGTIADIRQAIHDLQAQLPADIAQVQGEQPIVYPLSARHQHLQDRRQGAVLLQCCRELTQHHGHLDLTRDLLMQP